jgi:hypothetical protein
MTRLTLHKPLVLAAAVLLTTLMGSAQAQVAPGDTISKANADKVKDLVSPGVYWCVQHGWPMKIIDAKPIVQRAAFRSRSCRTSPCR